MKNKLIPTIFVCLTCFFSSEAQIDNAKNKSIDSLEVLAFNRLVSFLSVDTPSIKISEKEKNPETTPGESHFLVEPIHTMPGDFTQGNFSYDKFIATVYNKEATQGSPFLLPAYVPGLVVNQLDSVINKPAYLYNYDKMSGNLLLKRDNDAPIAVNSEQVKLFCLKLDKGGYIFMRVPLINSNEFLQVIYKGLKYSSYKLYKTRFVNANQKTNGYLSEGKDYDEYKDIETYYLVDESKEEWSVYELNKKSIKKSLGESAVIDRYFKDHKYDDITESFVAHLLESLNN